MRKNNPLRCDPAPATDPGLAAARRVLALEAEAVRILSGSLDERVGKALDLLAATKGRVVVTGMGKSGHIARKIAATFASTGTPAHFVHPAEAAHGDLGMISTGDLVFALSNSGKTSELAAIVAHTRRFAIPLLAVVGRARSPLAEAADVAIVLPDVEEACPLRLAPTSSSTMMLALGDAIAIALFERKGFGPDDFQALHPGGDLGRKLLKVSDLMHGGDRLPLVAPEARMADALLVMTQKSFGCIGVADPGGRLIGIVTDGDLRRHMSPGLLDQTVREVMRAAPKTIRPNALAVEALRQMNSRSITALFVVEGEHAVGILHIHDCLRAGIA
jgi:arabinose-5-phosphate isomerase